MTTTQHDPTPAWAQGEDDGPVDVSIDDLFGPWALVPERGFFRD